MLIKLLTFVDVELVLKKDLAIGYDGFSLKKEDTEKEIFDTEKVDSYLYNTNSMIFFK